MRRCGIGGRGEAGLRPDQPIEEAVLERSLEDEKTEIVVTSRDRQEDTPDIPPRLITPLRVSTDALSPGPATARERLPQGWFGGHRDTVPRSNFSNWVIAQWASTQAELQTLYSHRPETRLAGLRRSGLPTVPRGGCQARARFWLDGPVAAIPATRANAATPTAIAPMTENMSCQVSEGMVCFTMPWVA